MIMVQPGNPGQDYSSIQLMADSFSDENEEIASADARVQGNGQFVVNSRTEAGDSSLFAYGTQVGWSINGSEVFLPTTAGEPGQYLMLDEVGQTIWSEGTAGGLTNLTYAEFVQARIDGDLTGGKFIHITDRFNGAVFYCTNKYSAAIEGAAQFVNADYDGVGDYSGVSNFSGLLAATLHGVWSASAESAYASGDMVIWNNIHYQLVDKELVDGNAPDVNSTYLAMSTSSQHVGYITEWDTIIYNFDADALIWRMDRRGNKINNGSIETFQWGDSKFKPGDHVAVSLFEAGQKVDVQGVTIGKGYAGTIKRYNFASGRATHGNSRSHNVPGSIGMAQDPGREIGRAHV
jgi:hypothetical protein